MRARAIFCALLYGLLPSRLYEPRPHYDCGYWRHLALNLRHAARWATFRETASDREFERGVQRPVPSERCQRKAGSFQIGGSVPPGLLTTVTFGNEQMRGLVDAMDDDFYVGD